MFLNRGSGGQFGYWSGFVLETFFSLPFELNDTNKRLSLVMLGLSKVSLVPAQCF